MKKEHLTIIIILIGLWMGVVTSNATNSNGIDYSGKADTLTTALVRQFLNIPKGTFWAVPRNQSDRYEKSRHVYWQQAHAMDAVVYSYERIKDTNPRQAETYKLYMERWYANHANNWYHDPKDPTGFVNDYTDDMCWICLTMIHISEALDDDKYVNTARTVFDDFIVPRGSTDEKGIWALPWKLNYEGRGACTNGPACVVACKLFMKYGDEKYRQTAIALYDYMLSVMAELNNDGRVEEPPLSYTQGTFGEACRQLYHVTGKVKYLLTAQKVMDFLCTSLRCTDRGLLRNEGKSMDQSLFKAVAVPYLVNMVLDKNVSATYRNKITTFLRRNAQTLWSNLDLSNYPAVYCPYYWGEQVDTSEVPSMGAMTSGVSLIENVARMELALAKTESTDIYVPQTDDSNSFDVYTLDGRKIQNVDSLGKGIYVINRKKVIKK
jgi:predicted alpha-1,6-mannanase (GH76 family)